VTFIRFLLFFCILFLPSVSFPGTKDPSIDLLIFAPHPDDETLGCGGTILKALREHKKIKVVFLTNGDAYLQSAAYFFKKSAAEIIAQDYIILGQKRQVESGRATTKLGLEKDDIIFLSYPDSGLAGMWEDRDNNLYKSQATGLNKSGYDLTWGRAKTGYCRENLIQDVKDIIKNNRPKMIYVTSPLDGHGDHRAAANFINKALDELRVEQKNAAYFPARVSYYIIHTQEGALRLSPTDGFVEDLDLRRRKEEAWAEYETEADLVSSRNLWGHCQDPQEQFQEISAKKNEYLEKVYDQWKHIAQALKGYGCNLNFGPVADVAEEINDPGIDLVRRERIFSDDPAVVLELTEKIVQALGSEGVIPVVKHFPGLGSARQNTHKWLPEVAGSKESFYKKDIFPFRKLIERNRLFWIMTSHAIYPSLDNVPASLSYKIQTGLLRKELGFQGLIIADELLNMQALEEYALREHIPKPYIGEIVVRAFMAGTDIALIYPRPGQEEEVIQQVLTAVERAIAAGRITEKQIDDSVLRILKEKERIFNKPLRQLIKTMAVEKKIAQKLMIDTRDKYSVIQNYGLGGVEARDHQSVGKLQELSQIPLFIAGQHEGGKVLETALNIPTPSAYLIGREFERTLAGKKTKSFNKSRALNKNPAQSPVPEAFFDLSQLKEPGRQEIINVLLSSVDEFINFCSQAKKGTFLLSNPSFNGPLEFNMAERGALKLVAFQQMPIKWLRNFPDQNTARCAYAVFKDAFSEWEKKGYNERAFNEDPFFSPDKMSASLGQLKELIRQSNDKPAKSIRILCLAVHPDDEDTAALFSLKDRFNAETYILLATRGEGGENEIGTQLYEELGALRTEEVERSAAILGVKKVYYLGKKDFGYCFDLREALSNWDEQDALRRLVYFYRLIKPDIIITKHSSIEKDHCQHQALAFLAQEAFDLAGNPQVYPEMELSAWKPAGFYQRQIEKDQDYSLADILIDTRKQVGPAGKDCAQIAAEALSQHQSQGITSAVGLPGKIAYELVKGEGFFDRGPVFIPEEKKIPVASGVPGIKLVSNLKIGLFEQKSNILFVALKTLGCDFKKIDNKFIAEGDLSQFDTILIGKGLNDLAGSAENVNKRLLEFVEKGGNLVVIFQDKMMKSPLPAPYPLKIGFHPASDEKAPLRILLPEHPLFNFPNKISPRDFEGWTQDRGIYFPSAYADKYLELTSLVNGDSAVIKSGYLIAEYGKGSYIFTSYSWFRQLRESHLGSNKNLANMLAYPFSR
jgi:LmbE family N-acetylglucosaminyl deacetylase